MRRVLKGLVRFIFLALPAIVVVGGLGLLWMFRSLPPGSGAASVAGLSGNVTITRDSEGVPHIAGATRADVFAGLGFAHAEDRLWEMEINRLAGQGRLSEVFGQATVATDIWLRTMDLYGAARASLAVMSPEARTALDAYARGVNAWMGREGRLLAARLPPEFVILRHQPEPWTAADTLVTIKMMSVSLSGNVDDEIHRLAFARLGMSGAEIDDLLPPLEGDHPPPLPDLRALLDLPARPVGVTAEAGRQAAQATLPLLDTGSGASNNWVVSGTRTASGKPILANDPHLGLAAPSIWYLAHLRVETEFGAPRNLVGATLPGAPFVLLGRGDTIAWGFTNTGADVQDIFVEKVNPDDPSEYRTPDGWARFGRKTETIRVRGGKDVVFERRWTRHGPVLPASYRHLDLYLSKDEVAALSWVALAGDDTTAMAGFDIWKFRTVGDFQEGMKPFVTPIQSMVVADTAGSIGLVAPGRVPVRDPGNEVMGRAPVPGWDARYDWKGFIPYDALPRRRNPPEGAIATANARIVGPDYPYFLTFDWEEPFRQHRIEELIVDAPGEQTLETSRRAQADVYSTAFAELKPMMVALVGSRSDVDRTVLDGLSAWDAQMIMGSPQPLIFMAWLRRAMIDIYADDLGPAFEPWFRSRATALKRALGGGGAREWCDDRRTPQAIEDCGDILARALAEALKDLSQRYGDDRTNWRWGTAHTARGRHRPFSEVPVLNRIFDVEVPSPGGPYTLNRGVSRVADEDDPFGNTNAASYRGIFDLSDLDRSTFIQTTGQSGNVFSRHYRDFAARWASVEAITIPTDPSRYETGAAGRWILQPAR